MRRKVKYGGKPIALGEDDDHASAQSLRLALEGDERLIRKRRDGGLPQSQSEKDFLAGKIPRKKKPPKMATASRNFMAVQILEYCKKRYRGGVTPDLEKCHPRSGVQVI